MPNVPGTQNIIGFKYLFCGYAVQEWFDSNDIEEKYSQGNKVIVEQSVKLYKRCWKLRCDVFPAVNSSQFSGVRAGTAADANVNSKGVIYSFILAVDK